MQHYVGTSGYSYPTWKGKFYPGKLPQKEMLGYYADRFMTVEMNNTFYRLPEPAAFESWGAQVPPEFRFAIKAPQRITHQKRLKNVEEETRALLDASAALKRRRGPLLFQLPPNFRKDVPRLQAFLKLIRKKPPVAFEFRHESWFDDEVYDCLRKKSCALCNADTDELPCKKLVSTAPWGYMRLRREKYTDRNLRDWVKRIKSQDWQEVFVFFKHEDTGTGPKFAARLLELAGG